MNVNADPTARDDSSGDETLKLGDGSARPVPRAAWPASAFPAMERPGDLIGHYELLEELGKGGFGVVWRAEQTEPIHREVALKVIKPGMDSREIIARFESERQALAMMDHPNIAAVLDAGTTQNGRPFFAMELVKGTPITEYCNEHQLSITQRLELFIPVCQAVQHAHQKAILHRDLKPANILVTEMDGKPVPKVIDFGIAKALYATEEPALHATLARTMEGMFVGTPQYMSPEQAGSVPDVDTRSDIYTLGVILYELLVGDTPIGREQLKKAAMDEVLRVIRESEPRRPSSRFIPISDAARTTASMRHTEPKKLSHALRGDLDWILLKALEKDRARRYDTANDFALDLQRHLDDEPVSAGPPSAGYRLKKLVRRNRLAFGAAAAILAMLAAGIAVSTWQAVRATKAEKVTRENLSQSDFLQALRSINDDRGHDALAQLTRSLALNPQNDAALCRLVTLLTYRNFPLPVSRIKHDDGVRSARFSPDGQRIVTASWDKTARIWDAQSGKPLTDPFKHAGAVKSAWFSPDGQRIVTVFKVVTATEDKDVPRYLARVWDAQSGRPLMEATKDNATVYSAQFSPDGKRIVTASGDVARVWDVQSGKPLTKPMEGDATSAFFSPDGKAILAVSDGAAQVWDAHSGEPLTKPWELGADFVSAQFSSDGGRILIASAGSAKVWDTHSGESLTRSAFANNATAHILSAQFSPDGKWFFIMSWDRLELIGRVEVVDAQSGEPPPPTERLKQSGGLGYETVQFKLERAGEGFESAQFSPDGKGIVTASSDTTARVWDAQFGEPLIEPMKHENAVYSAQFSEDGKWIVTASGDHTARVWDVQSRQALTRPMKHHVQFSPDGKRRLVVLDGVAQVQDVQSEKPLMKALEVDGGVESAQFSLDGKRIVTVSNDEIVRVWDAQSGQPLTGPMKHDGGVQSAQFSVDGKLVVTVSDNNTAQVWDAENGKPLTGPPTGLVTAPVKHGDTVLPAQVSPDGKWVLTTSEDVEGRRATRVWDAKSGQPLTSPWKDDAKTHLAQFSPDGRRILTASEDNTAQVWDAQTGRPLIGPLKHDGRVLSAQFSPDGNRIVTASSDFTARVWDAQTGQPLTGPLKHSDTVFSAKFSTDGKRIVTASGHHGRQILGGTARVWDAQSGQPLTESFKHDLSVLSAEFSPDGKQIVTWPNNRAQVWDISPTGKPMPEWLPRLAEAVAGQHLNDRSVFEPLSGDPGRALEEIRAQLSRAPDDDDWTIWGRWFLADRSSRTISPFSKITIPEYIENRIKENTPASLDEAERLAVGNAELLQRIAKARKAP